MYGYDNFGWETADDCIGEEGYYDEDDAVVNANDPLRTEHDLGGRFDELEDDEDGEYVLKSEFDQYSDQINYDARARAITMAGVIAQSHCQTDDIDDAALEEEAVEYISMEEHLDGTATKENPGIPGLAKQPLRPFERWVEDVKAGRKKLSDPL